MPLSAKAVIDLVDKYKVLIKENPGLRSLVEDFLKIIPFALGGNNSQCLYQGFLSGSKLLQIFHQEITEASEQHLAEIAYKIKVFITILETCEVVLEKSVPSKFTNFTVHFIVYLKCALKLTLLLYFNKRIIYGLYKKSASNSNGDACCDDGIILKSGRVLRKVSAAPPLFERTWKPPKCIKNKAVIDSNIDHNVGKGINITLWITGELLYLLKPILVLKYIRLYKSTSWKPFMTSLFFDFLSLSLINWASHKSRAEITLTAEERREIDRRCHSLMYYAFRSPFYDKFLKKKVDSTFSKIPLIDQILKNRLEFYLSSYFSVWSD